MTTDPRSSTADNRPLRTVQGAADRLNVSTRTVRRLIDAGELPVVRIARSIRITDEDLDALIGVDVNKCPLKSM
jgi:excisionase family DNA binding protein